MIDTVAFTSEITADHLPTGQWFEEDGSCWQAERAEPHPITGKDWRWAPRNLKAFGKDEPEGRMHPFYPLIGLH